MDEIFHKLRFSPLYTSIISLPSVCRGAAMSLKLGVQFLGLGYYYTSTERNYTGLPSLVQSVT